MNNEYDVVVVGAGPAGSAAAKAAAEKKLKVCLLEQHKEVGVPQHCGGNFYSHGVEPKRFLEFVRNMDKRIILREYSKIRVFAPSGKIIREQVVAGSGYCVIRRDYLDRELARQAVNAGADLYVNTRVTGLLQKDNRVIGVTTSSTEMQEVYGKVVIGADGIHAMQKGVPKWAGLTRANQRFIAGIALDLTRVEDIDPDIKEVHYGSFSKMGVSWINAYDEKSCTTPLMSLTEFKNVKAGNYAFSRKLRNALPLRITGWSHAEDLGRPLPKIIDNGLILTGSAAGWVGNWMAIVSGGYAGMAAALAIQAGDVSAGNLGKYKELCTEINEHSYPFPLGFQGLSDAVIEKKLLEGEEPFRT
jgi:digeranylgeranylglycerophospholipid reductase